MNRRRIALLGLVGIVLVLGSCSVEEVTGEKPTPGPTPISKQETKFFKETKKTKDVVWKHWNAIAGIAARNGYNTASISDAEHDSIQRHMDVVYRELRSWDGYRPPSERIDPTVDVWIDCTNAYIRATNELGDMLYNPSQANKKAYKKALNKAEKAEKKFNKKGRQFIASTVSG